MASTLKPRSCNRCGINFAPSENTRHDWRSYCTDCRPEAQRLGWIPKGRPRGIIGARLKAAS